MFWFLLFYKTKILITQLNVKCFFSKANIKLTYCEVSTTLVLVLYEAYKYCMDDIILNKAPLRKNAMGMPLLSKQFWISDSGIFRIQSRSITIRRNTILTMLELTHNTYTYVYFNLIYF